MGILEKNEAKTEDMIDILSHYLENYRPNIPDVRLKISGDGLSCMRANQAISARCDAETGAERFDNVIASSTDWHQHNIMLQVSD